MLSDVRYGIRSLAAAPGFTAIAVVTLALGIGAGTAIFNAIDAVLLRPLPGVQEPEGLVNAFQTLPGTPFAGFSLESSYPDYLDIRESGVFDGLVGEGSARLYLEDENGTQTVAARLVTEGYFALLGVQAQAGRTFAPAESDIDSQGRVAVVSDGFWRGRLGADSSAIGRSLVLNDERYLIVGVTPEEFVGLDRFSSPDLWIPVNAATVADAFHGADGDEEGLLAVRDAGWLELAGRLRRDDTIETANLAVDRIVRQIADANPDARRGRAGGVQRLGREQGGVAEGSQPLLTLLSGAALLVLLIACMNVAGLMLVRAMVRRRETAVQMAVGAGTGTLVRQSLTQAVGIGLLGAVGGTVVAYITVRAIDVLGSPSYLDIEINARMLLFSVALGVGTSLLFGLAPAFETLRQNPIAVLRDESASVSASAGAIRLRNGFVALQLALSLVLLVGTGLFLRTLQEAYAVDLGYDVDRVLLADIDLSRTDDAAADEQAVYTQLLETIGALPGVETVALGDINQLSRSGTTYSVRTTAEASADDPPSTVSARFNRISESYFEALGIPLLTGRGFTAADGIGTPEAVIVSRSLAESLWPEGGAVGSLLPVSTPMQVIGVVADSVYTSPIEGAPRSFYGTLRQSFSPFVTLHVRSELRAGDLGPALERTIYDIDPRILLENLRPLSEELDGSLSEQRKITILVALFAGLAIALSAIGLYGNISYLTNRRLREIGLRMALGAQRTRLVGSVLVSVVRLVALALVIGIPGALLGARLIENRLFGVAATDAITWLGVGIVLAAAAILAAVIPAWKSARVDPARALRQG